MRKILWWNFLLLLFLARNIDAAPVAPIVHTLIQADGTLFSARMWGDEDSSGWETDSGHTILYDDNSGNWVYAQKNASGHLIKSQQFVIDSSKPPAITIEKHLRPAYSSSSFGESGTGPSYSPSYAASYPTSGAINVPVILIYYTDAGSTYTKAEITDVIFGDTTSPTYGSAKDYFDEVSYSALTFSDTHIVVDWVQSDSGHNYYGYANGAVRAAELVLEAVTKADTDIDYSLYDNDGDGEVDGVVIVHQGDGREISTDNNDIHAHKWSLTEAGLTPPTLDGKTIDNYIIIPETQPAVSWKGGTSSAGITTVGVFCHEFGHLLGLIELYDNDTDGLSEGIGEWGTMGSGNWNGVGRMGDCPAHYCAWSKFQLSWNTPVTPVETPLTNEKIEAAAVKADVYNFNADLKAGGTSEEHFMLENRQKIGFDRGLPGHGLLIWHIDDNATDNTDENHKLVDLEEADGNNDLDNKINRGDTGDPYPGSSNNKTFNFKTTPNNSRYPDVGGSSQVRVENISEDTSADTPILANLYFNNAPTLASPSLSPTTGDTSTSFTFKVNYADTDGDNPSTYQYVYIDGATSHYMSWDSGTSSSNGTYKCSTTLGAGDHTYYFYFEDGQGGSSRLPSSETSSGPTVTAAAGEEAAAEGDFASWNPMCFIATAAYGSPMAKEVKTLCRFRDSYLLGHPLGRKMVALYYKFSPPLASFISQHPWLKRPVRGMLKPIVKLVKFKDYHEDTKTRKTTNHSNHELSRINRIFLRVFYISCFRGKLFLKGNSYLWAAETGKDLDASFQKALDSLSILNLEMAYKRLEVIIRDFPQTERVPEANFWRTIISLVRLSRSDIMRDKYSEGIEKVSDKKELKKLIKLYSKNSQEIVESGRILVKDVKALLKYAGKPIKVKVRKDYDSVNLSREAFLPLKNLEKGIPPGEEETERLKKFYNDASYRYILGKSVGEKDLTEKQVIEGEINWSGMMMVIGNELFRYAMVCQKGWIDPTLSRKIKSPENARDGLKTAKECFEKALKFQPSPAIKTKARERIEEIEQSLKELK